MRRAVEIAPDQAALLGLEGMAGRRWFEVFDGLLPTGWTLPGRRRRPPTDPVNALLSLGYTLLHNRVRRPARRGASIPRWVFFTSIGRAVPPSRVTWSSLFGSPPLTDWSLACWPGIAIMN